MLRPNVEKTRDPLNVDALPPTVGMELDYRTSPAASKNARTWTMLSTISLLTGVVFAIVLFTRLLDVLTLHGLWAPVLVFTIWRVVGYPLAPDRPTYTSKSPPVIGNLVLMVLFFFVLGYEITFRRQVSPTFLFGTLTLVALIDGAMLLAAGERGRALIVASTGLLLAALFSFGRLLGANLAPFLLCLGGVALCCWLADGVATNFAMWANANPRLSRSTRIRWRKVWTQRFAGARSLLSDPLCLLSPTRIPSHDLRTYPVGIFLVALALTAAAIIAIALWPNPLTGFVAVAIAFVVLGLSAAGWNHHGLSRHRRRLARRAFWEAVSLWFTYNAHETKAPGVFQSPWGSRRRRVFLTAIALFFLASGMLTTAKYFPFALLATGPKPWTQLAEREHPAMNYVLQFVPPNPARDELLTPRQEEEYARLPVTRQSAYLTKAAKLRDQAERERHRASIEQRLADVPETWLMLAFYSGAFAESLFPLSTIPSLLVSLFAPLAFMLLITYAFVGRATLCYYEALEADDATEADLTLTPWDAYTRRLRESPHQAETRHRERDHLWMGTSVEHDYPVLVHRDILREHAHILGDSGSGKTSLALAPLVTQLLRHPDRTDQEPHQLQPSLLIIDLKGDDTLFQAARIEAEREKVPFRFFTNDRYKATYAFNPLLQSHMQSMTLNQRVQILMQALGLEHGDFYGGSYYSSVNEDACRKLFSKWNDILSFSRLAEKCRDSAHLREAGISKEDAKDAKHFFNVAERLASVPAVNIAPNDNRAEGAVLQATLDMQSLLQTRQVVYFYLKTLTEAVSVQAISKLALYSLLTAAAERPETHNRPALVIIDEFQQIVARNLEVVLRQARSMGIGVILANQNITDLKTPDADLVPTVGANTRFKQVFSATAPSQLEYLVQASGEAMYTRQTISAETKLTPVPLSHLFGVQSLVVKEPSSMSLSNAEDIGPRLRPNDMYAMTDDPLQSVVHVSRGMGYTQFKGLSFLVRSEHHITHQEYTRRQNEEKWPQKTSATLVADDLFPAQPPAPPAKAPAMTPLAPTTLQPHPAQLEFETQLASFTVTTPPPEKKSRKRRNQKNVPPPGGTAG